MSALLQAKDPYFFLCSSLMKYDEVCPFVTSLQHPFVLFSQESSFPIGTSYGSGEAVSTLAPMVKSIPFSWPLGWHQRRVPDVSPSDQSKFPVFSSLDLRYGMGWGCMEPWELLTSPLDHKKKSLPENGANIQKAGGEMERKPEFCLVAWCNSPRKALSESNSSEVCGFNYMSQ